MERTLVAKILDDVSGVSKGDEGYELPKEHHAALFIGVDGASTVLADLVRVKLHDDFVEAEAKDRTIHAVSYDAVRIVSVRRPRDKKDNPRTGF